VFTHFLEGLQNANGPYSQAHNSSWDECVAAFDVEAYAADTAATGAKYAVFRMMQVIGSAGIGNLGKKAAR
jgi:hypothetical protein